MGLAKWSWHATLCSAQLLIRAGKLYNPIFMPLLHPTINTQNPFFSSDTIIAIKTTSNSSETFSHQSAKLYFPFFPEASFCGQGVLNTDRGTGGTNRELRALGMRFTTEPRRELKHNEQPHLWSSLQKGAESSDEAAHCKPQQHSSRSRWCTRIRSLWALQGHTTPLSSVFVLEHWHINNPASFYALHGIIIFAQMIFLVIFDHPNSWKAYKWAPHNSTKATARKKLNTPLALCFSPTYLHI